jgi:hypothetical protein
MTIAYARGTRALGLCDRCGFQQKLNELRWQIVDRRPTGLRVCESCFDQDHPQLQLGRVPVNDPQALRDARPDPNTDRSLYGWQPVGNPANTLTASVGAVSVRTT